MFRELGSAELVSSFLTARWVCFCLVWAGRTTLWMSGQGSGGARGQRQIQAENGRAPTYMFTVWFESLNEPEGPEMPALAPNPLRRLRIPLSLTTDRYRNFVSLVIGGGVE